MTRLHVLDPNPDSSPAVLLLHGLGATGTSWGLQFPPLIKAGYRPIAPDAPGFGDSPIVSRPWTIRGASDEIASMLGEMETGRVHVIGLSMGGVLAQQLVHDHPHLVDRLMLASTYAVMRPKKLSTWFYFLRRLSALSFRGIPAQAEVVARQVFPKPEQAVLREMLVTTISSADKKTYQEAMRSLGLFDSRRWLNKINHPTLVISGAMDTTVPPKAQLKLAEGIPGARQVLIEDGGHAVNVDQFERFNEIMMDFLG